MAWEVSITNICRDWFHSLNEKDQDRVIATIDRLEADGPSLGEPLVKRINGSRHHNMKELRPGTMRILFIFDPEREAVLLVGGDKRDNWTGWYETAIPQADALYDKYLTETGQSPPH